ncbi:MAG: hypothetical protein AAGI17_02355 [Planctomycetota bacterium]
MSKLFPCTVALAITGAASAQTTPPPLAFNVHTGVDSLILPAFATGPAPYGLASFVVPPDIFGTGGSEVPPDTAAAFAIIDDASIIPGIDQDIPGFDLVLVVNVTPFQLEGVGFGFGQAFADLTDFNGGMPAANGLLPPGGLYLTLISEQDTRDITFTLDTPAGVEQRFTFSQASLIDAPPARAAFIPIPAPAAAGAFAAAGLVAARRRR